MTSISIAPPDNSSPLVVSIKSYMSNVHSSKEVIMGIINQTYSYKKNDKIIVNIVTDQSQTFCTRETGTGIKFLNRIQQDYEDLVIVNYVDYDWGNVTNILEALSYIERIKRESDVPPYTFDTRLIYCEDHIHYPDTMVETMNLVTTVDSNTCIWGASGFDIHNMTITLRKEHATLVEVIEGYGGVVVPIGAFVTDFMEYINFIRDTEIILLLNSSDIVISNYFSKHKIPKRIARLENKGYTFDSIWSRIKYIGSSSKNIQSRNDVWEGYIDAIYLLSGWKELYLRIIC